jgi:hypothetical protein
VLPLGKVFMINLALQIPENWPVVSPEGVLVGIVVCIVVTLLIYKITESRWSWLPGIIFGVIAAIAVTSHAAATAVVMILLQAF